MNLEYVYRVRVFNSTFNNIPVIWWRSVSLMKETGVPGETTDSPQVTANLYQIMLYGVHLVRAEFELHNVSGDRH